MANNTAVYAYCCHLCVGKRKTAIASHHPLCPLLQHIKAHCGKPNVITVYNRGGSTSFPRRFHQFLCVPIIRKFLHLTASENRVVVWYSLQDMLLSHRLRVTLRHCLGQPMWDLWLTDWQWKRFF